MGCRVALPVVLRDDHEGSPLRIQKPDRFPATLDPPSPLAWTLIPFGFGSVKTCQVWYVVYYELYKTGFQE